MTAFTNNAAPAPQSQAFTVFEDEHVQAFLSPTPSTPGETVVRIKAGALLSLAKNQFVSVLLSAKAVASIVKSAMKLQRVSLVTTAQSIILLVPLHGLGFEWEQIMGQHLEYYTSYPGFISSLSGPKLSNEALCKAQTEITKGRFPAMDPTCIADSRTSENLFAKIIRGELEQWRLWESDSHVAFLTPFGNTYGKTVLVPRKHLDSDILSLPDDDYGDLAGAVWEMMEIIIGSRLEVDRVGLIFEGMEVNWAHAKLIPICGDDGRQPSEQPFTEKYIGSVSSQPGPVANVEDLKDVMSKFLSIAT
jgi:diadenosine tetraphosphate (Ap4A) HIT family hydrolase